MSDPTHPIYVRTEAGPLTLAGGNALIGTESIGRGYNIFGHWAYAQSTRARIFDLGEAHEVQVPWGTFHKPAAVDFLQGEQAHYRKDEGSSIESFTQDRAGKVGIKGKYGLFKGSLDIEFASEVQQYSSFYYLVQTDVIKMAFLRLKGRPPLADDARDALHTHTVHPKDVFDKYGTHYVKNLVLGGTATYCLSTNTVKYKSDVTISVAAQAAYEGLTAQASVETKGSMHDAVERLQSSSVTTVTCQGGDASLGGEIMDGKYGAWRESVHKFPGFVDFDTDNKDSLQPIWTLVEDPKRRADLKEAFDEYARQKGGVPESPFIVPIYAFHAQQTPSRWYYSQLQHDPTKWAPSGVPFYVAGKQIPGTKPVFRHHALSGPERYKYSMVQKERHNWSDGTEKDIAFYAYPPDSGQGVPIFGYSCDNTPDTSGWHYTTARTVKSWTNHDAAFCAQTPANTGYTRKV